MILQKNQLRKKLWIFQKMEFELQNNMKRLIDIYKDEKMLKFTKTISDRK